jgi:hypothetical protein
MGIVTKPRASVLNESTFARIDAVAKTATAEEVAAVAKLIERAKASIQETAVVKITPAMAALVFVDHNGWNRQWKAKKVNEYARRMKAGAWKWNGEGLSFYNTGDTGDGQHRLAAAALAGFTLNVPVAFGVEPEAVDTIDDAPGRAGYDHAEMDHIKDTKSKQAILKAAAAYFAKVQPDPIEFDLVGSAAEFHRAIKKHDALLSKALDIADDCKRGCSSPVLKRPEAARTAFVMLFGGWPAERVAHVLHRLQQGTALDSEGGEMSPLTSWTRGRVARALPSPSRWA